MSDLMARYLRDDLPTLTPQEDFEGFQGGPLGGVWYCTAFYPYEFSWLLPVAHPEAQIVGRAATPMGFRPPICRCPWCGVEWVDY